MEVRPPDAGTWTPPRRTRTWGDPHITTLDGHTYLFNGRGEYVAFCADVNAQELSQLHTACNPNRLSNSTVRVHLRFDVSPTTDNATVTVGAAMVVPGQVPVLVVLNSGELELYGGNARVFLPNLGAASSVQSSIGLIRFTALINGTTITKVTLQAMDVSVELQVTGTIMRASGSVGLRYVNHTVGLWGLFDDDVSNDFKPSASASSGANVLLSASEESVYDDFGQTWMILIESQSAFGMFQDGPWGYWSFWHPRYRPSFTSPSRTPAEEQAAVAACSSVVDIDMRDSCVYDVLVTGDVSPLVVNVVSVVSALTWSGGIAACRCREY